MRPASQGGSKGCVERVLSAGGRLHLSLPLWAEDTDGPIIKALENPKIWGPLSTGLLEGKYIDSTRAETAAEMLELDPEELIAAAQRKLDGLPSEEETPAEEGYRRQEYDALRVGRGGPDTELLVDVKDVSEYPAEVSGLFSSICLVRKLRETRALAGFTRLNPPDGDLASDRLQFLSNGPGINWLPAMVVRGEGIFLEFNDVRIKEWLKQREPPGSRLRQLLETYERNRILHGQEPRNVSAKFVMMHTFAHMLINQLAFDCGYGSASLRERIYCNFEEDSEDMQGVLIYTASGDSEGTMGGLVRQGEPDRLPETLHRAARKAQWCSSDPVCIESAGQGTDNANLAACHACVLLSETSCEEGNRLLDRATVIGTPEDPYTGFLHLLLATKRSPQEGAVVHSH